MSFSLNSIATERYKSALTNDIYQLLNKEYIVIEKNNTPAHGDDYLHYADLYMVKNKLDNSEVYSLRCNNYFESPYDGLFFVDSKLIILPKPLRKILVPATIKKQLKTAAYQQKAQDVISGAVKHESVADATALLQRIHKIARTPVQEKQDEVFYNEILSQVKRPTVHAIKTNPFLYSIQNESQPITKPGRCETLFDIKKHPFGRVCFYEICDSGANVCNQVSPYMAAQIWQAIENMSINSR